MAEIFSYQKQKGKIDQMRFFLWLAPKCYLQSDTPDLHVTAKKPITRYEYVQGATD